MSLNPIDAVGEAAESIGEAADKNFTSADETNTQLTERLRIDMAGDSWLAKNIRPLTLIWLLTLFTWLLLVDLYTDKEPSVSVLNLLGSLLTTIILFYFGSRAAEKITQIITNSNAKQANIITKAANRREGLFSKLLNKNKK